MAGFTKSILLTVKKMLGIAEEYHAFDIDITININSVFLSLNQLGVGPSKPFQITGEKETWDDVFPDGIVPGVQTYVYLKTRLLFDPPTNSFLVDNMKKQIDELEWRMMVQCDPVPAAPSVDESKPEQPIIPEPITPELIVEDPAIEPLSSKFATARMAKSLTSRVKARGVKT